MANGKAATVEATTERELEWENFKKQFQEIVNLFGSLIFTPAIILVGICYGIRAGIIAGTEKTLHLLRAWGK
jgi:hypothetical protein